MLGGKYDVRHDPADSVIGDEPGSPSRGVASFIGHSGVDLDGESLMLPDGDFADEISSINTSNYGASSPGRHIFGERYSILGNAAGGEPAHVAVGVMALDISRHEVDDHTLEKETLPESPGSEYPDGNGNDDDDSSGLLPSWIADAPCWLKFVIITTTALLVGAIALVAVAFALSHFNKQSTSSTPMKSSVNSASQPSVSPAIANFPSYPLPTTVPKNVPVH